MIVGLKRHYFFDGSLILIFLFINTNFGTLFIYLFFMKVMFNNQTRF